MNKYLNKFYMMYLNWIEMGAAHNAPFRRDTGLCTNLSIYQEKFSNANYSVYADVVRELKMQWRNEGLDTHTPFTPAENQYRTEAAQQTAHLNQARLQWVKARVAEYKEQ